MTFLIMVFHKISIAVLPRQLNISLAKDTARNTQKRTDSFVYQAAQRYVENLVITKAWNEICPAKKLIATHTPENPGAMLLNYPSDDDAPTDDANWGRKFHVSVGPDGTAQCQWTKQRGGKAPIKVSVNDQVLHFLIKHCLPCTALNHLDCFTHYENKTSGERYCAHPMFMGDSWYDFAMVRWQSREHPKLPA
jgi:hypothetical protein